jgi:DNA-binding CsgD family transcriptional regulator
VLEKHLPTDFIALVSKQDLKTQQLAQDYHRTLARLERSQKDLRQRMVQLKILHQELLEAHKAILALTQKMETVRQEVREQIMSQIRFLLLPFLEHMCTTQGTMPDEGDVDGLCQFIAPVDPVPFTPLVHTSLTSQELRIISMIRQGMTNDEIADQLYIAPTTVKTHRRNIRKKLGLTGAKNRLQTYFQTAEIQLPTLFVRNSDHTIEGRAIAQ